MSQYDTHSSLQDVLSVIADMQAAGLIERYAIGEAFAAVLHLEPLSTIDLDIFFMFRTVPKGGSQA